MKVVSHQWSVVSIAVSAMVFALSFSADAQQQAKIPRVGYLAGGASSLPQAFVQGLRDRGYFEGKNIFLDFRTTEGKSARSSDLVAELIRLKVDIMVTEGTSSTLAAKKLTSTIPIVMAGATDAVATGLVESLARPGGNVTGLTSVTGELGGKLIELLKEIIPRLSRVVVPGPPPDGSPSEVLFMKENRNSRARIESSVDKFSRSWTRGLRRYFSSRVQRTGECPVGAHTGKSSRGSSQMVCGIGSKEPSARDLHFEQLDGNRWAYILRR
jgi:putative tryptophan/tyrosine transport system substrate-binding protein